MNSTRGSYLLGAALGCALLLALSANAMAADIYQPPAYEPPPPPPPSERAYYFKGYLGMANPSVGNITSDIIQNGDFTIYHDDMKSSPLFGLGVGIQTHRWLRFDLTGEYRGDTTFLGQDRYASGPGFRAGTNEYTADVQSWLGLANAYIDMGNWCGFTPYVGAGVGFASFSVDGFKDINVPNRGVAYGADHSNTNLAWAIHAGVSYDVSPQLAVDLAYRYANLGDIQTGIVTPFDFSTPPSSGLQIKDITSNDLMLGLRYKLQREPVAFVPVK